MYTPDAETFSDNSLRSCRLAAVVGSGTIREKLMAGGVWSGANELSEEQRATLVFRFEEELELSEIALATRMKRSTFKRQLYLGVGSIRDGMERSALSAIAERLSSVMPIVQVTCTMIKIDWQWRYERGFPNNRNSRSQFQLNSRPIHSSPCASREDLE